MLFQGLTLSLSYDIVYGSKLQDKGEKEMRIFLVFVLIAVASVQVQAASRATERHLMKMAAVDLKMGQEPTWKGVDPQKVKDVFSAAFDQKGQIRPQWVARFRKILAQAEAGKLSKPQPPAKKGEKWRFVLTQRTLIVHFTLEASSHPIRVTERIIID